MAERPDFVALLRQHLPRDRYDEEGESLGTYCSCGEWSGNYFADGEAGSFDDHLAAVLNAAVDAWLADEGTRERVAEVIDRRAGRHMGVGSWMPMAQEITNTLAGHAPLTQLRAALTTDPTQGDPR